MKPSMREVPPAQTRSIGRANEGMLDAVSNFCLMVSRVYWMRLR